MLSLNLSFARLPEVLGWFWGPEKPGFLMWSGELNPPLQSLGLLPVRTNICIKNSELKVWPLSMSFFKPHVISSLNLTVCPVNIFFSKYMKAWVEALPLPTCRGWQCDINVKRGFSSTAFPGADTPRLIQGNKGLLERLAGMQGWYFFIYWLQ